MSKFYLRLATLLMLLLSSGLSPSWAQTTLIDPATDGGFENGATLTDNGWVVVNGTQTNQWFAGSVAVPANGSNSAYISSSPTGATYDYNINAASVVSFYKDFTIPAGESKLQVDFNWKGVGEGCCDYLRVRLAPATITPVAGTQTTGGVQLTGNLNAQAAYQTFSATSAVLPGVTYRLIIEWRNDGSLGPSPAASIDDISVVSSVPGSFITIASGNWNDPAIWDAAAVPTSADNAIISIADAVTINATGLAINDLTVNGVLSYTTPAAFTVNGNLEVSAGAVFNVFSGTTGKTLNVGGNIVNNGSIDISVGSTTAGTLVLNGPVAQTISGTGTFVNGFIRNLTCSNTSTSIPNINWLIGDIKVAYNLNISGAKINLGSNKLTWGNNAAGNTFTAPAGSGFLAGGKFARWWTTAQTGSAITAGTDPTTVTSRYPFLSPSGDSRTLYISRSSSSTTGNTAGELAVVYTDVPGITGSLSIVDGAYTITDRFNSYWTVTAENGYVYASGTHTVAAIAAGAYPAANGNSHVLTDNAPLAGTHQNGATTPSGQRTGLSTTDLTIATGLYLGANSADIIQPCTGTPSASNTVSSVAIVCPSTNFNLSLGTSYTGSTGIAYQWQSSPDGVTFTDISGANNATYTANQAAATFYQCIITCTGSGLFVVSTPVEVDVYGGCFSMPVSGSASTCDAKFFDTGGSGANYAASENRTFTFYPTTPGAVVQVTFNSFATESGWDFLRIYDGNSTSAPALHTGSGFSGTTINPTVFTSTAADGALTFAFTSDGGSQSAGWDADVSCIFAPLDPSTPTQTAGAVTCVSGAELTVSGTAPVGDEWYWQTSASGTSTTTPVSGPYIVFQNGTYYVRAFNPSTGLWSVNAPSVIVSNVPVAAAPPAPVAAASPACLNTDITVAAPADPNVTYYWQGTIENGVDNTLDASAPYNVTASGTYYVAAFDASTSCWSLTSEVAVLIDTEVPPAPTGLSPVDVCIGATSAQMEAEALATRTETQMSGSINLAIPDNNTTGITNTLTISGIPAGAQINSVSVNLNITHTFNGDLEIFLTGPNATQIELSTDNGGGGDNYTNTTFDNNAATLITAGTSPFTGTFRPEGDLTTLFSVPNGGWELYVRDDANGDIGNLLNWSISINYTAPVGDVTWWDAASGPAQLGTGTSFEAMGTSVLPDGLTPGTYSFFAQSQLGTCISTSRTQIDVVVNPATAVLDPVNVTCNGLNNGSFTVSSTECATAPFEFSVDGAPFTSTIPTNLAPGTYAVVLKDANAFETAPISLTITEPAVLMATEVHANPLCNGATTGSIDVTISGGTAPFIYTWSNSATTEDQPALGAGNYSLIVSDANGCLTSMSVTLTEPAAIVATASHVSNNCFGETNGSIDVSASGGTGTLDYSWNNGASTEDISGLAAGTYTLTITDDNSCTETVNVTITEPAVLSAVITTATQPSACGLTDGAIDATVSGGTAPYTFTWSNGGNTEDITAVGADVYTLDVTDANGCTISAIATLNDPNAPVIAVNTVVNTSCNAGNDGEIDVNVSAGTFPYTYSWDNGSSLQDLTGLAAGNYTLTVTDAASCVSQFTVAVDEPTAITATAVVTDLGCNGDNDGAIDVTVSGGTEAGVYDFLWSNTAITEDVSGLTAGSYTVTVTDDNACAFDFVFDVTEPDAIAISGLVTDVNCNSQLTGNIDISISGGTPSFSVFWSNGSGFSANTEDVSGLAAEVYAVTVVDANGCTANTTFTVNEPAALVLTSVVTDETTGNDGAIDLTVAGGTAPFTYSWSNSQTTEDISGLVGGSYTVTVVDANGCTETHVATVTTTIGVDEITGLNVSVYPNPSSGIFFIELSGMNMDNNKLVVRDALGRQISEQHMLQPRITLDMNAHERGIYFVEIWSGDQKTVRRIILQR